MKNIKQLLLAGALLLATFGTAWSQSSPNCATASDNDYYIGKAIFNYGSVSNSFNTRNRANVTVGQPVVGQYFGQLNKGTFGFWGSFLLPPAAPMVMASQGDLEDRVQVDWNPDPLSPTATSYKIYRNGALLATVDGETFSFLDFNVIAGRFYTYSVSGVNGFGEGSKGDALGFLSPNGVITGQVKSIGNNPVAGALVTLSPTTGAALSFNGTDGMAFANYDTAYAFEGFTLSCWVKFGAGGNDSKGIIDLGSSIGKNIWLHTLPTAAGTGVRFGMGRALGDVTELNAAFEAGTEADWHHVAASYDGNLLLLFVDGELEASKVEAFETDSMPVFFGRKSDGTAFFNGKLDEVRLFNKPQSGTDIKMFMSRTVNTDAEGLVGYWKFDENVGDKAFDLTARKNRAYLCGASWTSDRANVVNAGMTDATGFYRIAGINYGAGTTFTARPSKYFYKEQALEFTAANESLVDLPELTYLGDTSDTQNRGMVGDTATLYMEFEPYDLESDQILYSEADSLGNVMLEVRLENGEVVADGEDYFDMDDAVQSRGSAPLSIKQPVKIAIFRKPVLKNGPRDASKGAATKPRTIVLGARACKKLPGVQCRQTTDKNLNGKINAVAVLRGKKPLPTIRKRPAADGESRFTPDPDSIGINVNDPDLLHYFTLDEGGGSYINDLGPGLAGKGTIENAGWSPNDDPATSVPHEFTPSIKLATLTPSNTAVDQIDFIDQSTVPVSGFVRFDGTTCFQKGVEILVNGGHATPPCYTDSLGYFSLELEPGESAVLSPTFKTHTFYPAFWEVDHIASPLAGVLFRNQVKRSIEGQMTGNRICRKSVIPVDANGDPTAIVKVAVESLDGCYYKEYQFDDADGKFKFKNLPPIKFTVKVTEHSNNVIYNYFQLQGGKTLDLTEQNDTTDFIYYAPPEVEMTPFDTNACGTPMLEQDEKYSLDVRIFQDYEGGRCYLDTAEIHIDNLIEGTEYDTLMTTGKIKYRFTAGFPNITAPYLQGLTVLAKANEQENTFSQSAVILGKRPRLVNFASTSPQIPMMILRDPPGDGSAASIEKGKTVCNGWSMDVSASVKASVGLKLDLGNKQQIITGTPVAGTITEIGVDNSLEMGMSVKTGATVNTSAEVCLTANETISTSSGDVIIGEDADVYVGGALNLLFGITDDLRWDTANCDFYLDKGLLVFPDKFATTFMYSGWQIKNVVIPNLLLVGDTTSANAWQETLQRNQNLKNAATFEKNVSFDAGVTYENSTTIENTRSSTFGFDVEIGASIAAELGFSISGTGSTFKMGMEMSMGVSSAFSNSQSNSQTVAYTFADDDIGDVFTVDVFQDKVYGTPVFKTVSGNSSCPYEPNTVPHDGVSIAVDKTVAANVSANDKAVFKFTLGNQSQTDAFRYYDFGIYNASNPDGAIIKVQGAGQSGTFGIDPGKSQEVIVTIERGPVAYDYDNLTFNIYSACEDAHATALGLCCITNPEFYKAINVDVHFVEPCSPVDIGFPQENWVWQQADGQFMFITLNSFNRYDTDLELIRVQYRRKYGDGAWINIVEVPKAGLDNDLFHIIQWNTAALQDGEYEIRAVTQCFSGQDAGISHIISGRFEREAPGIFGTPEPADGVYSAGDEISIRFNEPIRCDQPDLIQADQFSNNNIGLYNAETDELVDAQLSCSGDKIVLVPRVPNHFIENKLLRVEVDNIKDLAGNTFVHAQWEFTNDRNNLNWVDNVPVYVSKYEEEIKSVTRRIENRGGFNQDFNITGTPDWVRVFPKTGTLASGQVQVITFEFDSTLVFGNYQDTVVLEGALGDEPLLVTGRVVCKNPAWQVNAGDWDYSMNLTVQLDMEGTLTDDIEDIVAAYVGGEVRGVAKVEHVPAVDKYIAFLTVYSNEFSGETVEFRIWDASECLLYGEILETFTFEADGLEGSPQMPTTLHTDNRVLREIELRPGWNWVSFNLAFPDNSVSAALSSVNDPSGDLVKSQTQFTQNTAGLGWLGSLTALGNTSMYQYRTADADTIVHLGTLIDPASLPIPVAAGWNWIGYLPQQALTVNEALASLAPSEGDLIKSQTQFAQFVSGFGWIGNLKFMSPPNGYLLKMSNAGTLTYPNTGNRPLTADGGRLTVDGATQNSKPKTQNSAWTVNPAQFELSQTMIAMLVSDGANVTQANFELGAFVNGECRGAATALWVEPLGVHLFFLTMYANTPGEPLVFKLHDGTVVLDLSETLFFSADASVGTVQDPFRFTTGVSSDEEPETDVVEPYLGVEPNPVRDGYATVRFRVPASGEVRFTLTDATGRTVQQFDYQAQRGMNALMWEAAGHLPPGAYFLRMVAAEHTMTEKVEVR
ncbi:MAG: LamG-like jellyroll fold domain-containing protein [Saprospiraceae bacterium]